MTQVLYSASSSGASPIFVKAPRARKAKGTGMTKAEALARMREAQANKFYQRTDHGLEAALENQHMWVDSVRNRSTGLRYYQQNPFPLGGFVEPGRIAMLPHRKDGRVLFRPHNFHETMHDGQIFLEPVKRFRTKPRTAAQKAASENLSNFSKLKKMERVGGQEMRRLAGKHATEMKKQAEYEQKVRDYVVKYAHQPGKLQHLKKLSKKGEGTTWKRETLKRVYRSAGIPDKITVNRVVAAPRKRKPKAK